MRWRHPLPHPPSILHPTPLLVRPLLAYSPSVQELHFPQDCQALPRNREESDIFTNNRTVGGAGSSGSSNSILP